MSLPFVVSAVKAHSIQIKSMRENCITKVFKEHDLNKNFVPNITSSKVHLHNRKNSRLTRKKAKKKSSRLVKVPKATEFEINNVLRNKSKENQGKQNTILSTKSHSTTKVGNKSNPNDLNTSPSVVICSVKKLMSSYSTKNISTLPQTMWKNRKISPRPKSSGGKTSEKQISEVKINRLSCPSPLFQPRESPISKSVKLRKVYYSEAHSHMLAGVPSVPPTTPLNDNLVAVEIVPCLADIKSQQAIKTKLKHIVTQRQKADERLREKITQEVKRKEREQIENLKQQRRAEIYALNEVMTEHERNKFLLFMKEKNNGATTISLNV